MSDLKGTTEENGHPGESGPLDEQKFIVNTVDSIEKSKYWPSTAIVITYDDSDGWYHHVVPKIVNGSRDPALDTAMREPAPVVIGNFNAHCGYGQRLPLIVISPWTRKNYVSDSLTDTTSVVKFIDDNWLHGERIRLAWAARAMARPSGRRRDPVDRDRLGVVTARRPR